MRTQGAGLPGESGRQLVRRGDRFPQGRSGEVDLRKRLIEHTVVGWFTPRPESIDIDAAVSRWLQERSVAQRENNQPAAEDTPATIDIRAYSNSDGVLVVWRADQWIDGCLGFALHRRELRPGGITEQLVTTTLDFRASRQGQ
jgi:hypothetical protein